MNKAFLSILLFFVVVAGALLFQASREGTAMVLLPSELLAKGKAESLNRIRVAGRITPTEVSYQVEPQFELKFHIEDPKDPKGSIPVIYNGLRPDMFATGRDVIIDGNYSSGVLYASKLLTQCPSKYEPPKPSEMYK